jgi:hypothetical protein
MTSEWRVYEALRHCQASFSADPSATHPVPSGFPVARFGRHVPSASPQAPALHVLAMEALGPDLGALLANRQPGAAAAAATAAATSTCAPSSVALLSSAAALPLPPPRGLSLKTVLALGEQMVGLLQRLHAAGICHRDLKVFKRLARMGQLWLRLCVLGLQLVCIAPRERERERANPLSTLLACCVCFVA